MKKIISLSILASIFFSLSLSSALAHVVVKPNTAGLAAFQSFAVGVPNEKDVPTVAVRLVIPEGLKHVTPNVKPGWKIDVKKSGTGEDASVTEISWTGGSIPAGQRDEFAFSAQVPATETSINWKAYQTYAGNLVVSWDQAPVENQTQEEKDKMHAGNLGPYSSTKIVNDLAPVEQSTNTTPESSSNSQLKMAVTLSLILSAVSTGLHFIKKSS